MYRTTLLARARFNELWGNLPALTVLAAFPGWGRTTLLQQCDEWLASHATHLQRRWIRDRDSLTAVLERGTVRQETVYLVDDVLASATDPLWGRLLAFARSHPTQRFLVASIDTPLFDEDAPADVVILDERHIRFSRNEQAEIARTLPEGANFSDELKGCPSLIHLQWQRLSAQQDERQRWTPMVVPELQLFKIWAKAWPEAERPKSALFTALHNARYLRRFSFDILARDTALQRILAAQFPRLDAMPMFVREFDAELEVDVYAWTRVVWGALTPHDTRADRSRGFTDALERVRDAGMHTGQLYYLLTLRHNFEAEELVASSFDECVRTVDQWTEELLLQQIDPQLFPHRALLSVELHRRRYGPSDAHLGTVALALESLRLRRAPDPRGAGSYSK
ncbi:hypothetical protein [Tessaracoccus oleiagri]|uniref:Uncharacterized protein n=1 Tax=Tessaracoccus oleiagri TaxID=686624 RepID=A0A1G9KH35_9ACTN|nr:hypothetical protein [Tessaracoccus oleiagri]SDL48683.1 hypothetical protein SAMN04488242_1616 [Tessaracoccus oleiagri]